ncbi:ribonuclease P protein subunit p25-like protein [Impatiens glandulifera]|uniref:ribonuclease P protein subunit p25-like protein n=1 Tax=Impatiens glandulifera TaxID=253017 RepID=UPI001FB0C7C0|nr:ribonuclease P protein subunit p25-like protein [Impatiens glandulifera]
MDRYRRIEKPKAEKPIEENEIRITSQGRMRNYITYAMSLLQDKGSNEIVFKAMGRAINKTVTIVELIKRRIVGIHQVTSICSTDITDVWEPIEEGLNPVETTRHVSMITITLSKMELDVSSVGYQPPIPAEEVRTAPEFDYEGGEESPSGGRGRGRGRRGRGGRSRGGYGNGFIAPNEYEEGGWDRNRGFARGRGRGRGRGFRGRGRGGGGYDGGQFDNNNQYDQEQGHGRGGGYDDGGYYDNQQQGGGGGGYQQEPPFQGRGRGRGSGRGNNRGRGRGGFRSNGPIESDAVGA